MTEGDRDKEEDPGGGTEVGKPCDEEKHSFECFKGLLIHLGLSSVRNLQQNGGYLTFKCTSVSSSSSQRLLSSK